MTRKPNIYIHIYNIYTTQTSSNREPKFEVTSSNFVAISAHCLNANVSSSAINGGTYSFLVWLVRLLLLQNWVERT